MPISAHLEWNLDELVEKMWEYLDLLRIYTKPKGQAPDYSTPVVVPASKNSISSFCSRIHRQMIKDFKYALIWGTSVKHHP